MAISKADFLRLILAVLVAQVAVGFHAQHAAVLMPQPARDRRNVHAGLDTARGKQMAQIVVRDAGDGQSSPESFRGWFQVQIQQ